MKKIFPIAAIAVLFSQVSFAEATRTIYSSPIFYTTHPSNIISHDLDAVTTTKTKISTKTKTETKIKKIAKVEASNSESKTEGSYVGLDLFGTKTTLRVKNTFSSEVCPEDCTYYDKPDLTNNSYGLGLTYKYAFNFNKFFIAPGIFFEQNNYQAVKGTEGSLTRLQIKNRYGIRSDFGYDIKRFAPYLTIGYAEVSYRSRSFLYNQASYPLSEVKNSIEGNIFYGAGLKFNLTPSLSLNTEYNFQKVAVKTNIPPLTQELVDKQAFRARMDTVKVGLYYKF